MHCYSDESFSFHQVWRMSCMNCIDDRCTHAQCPHCSTTRTAISAHPSPTTAHRTSKSCVIQTRHKTLWCRRPRAPPATTSLWCTQPASGALHESLVKSSIVSFCVFLCTTRSCVNIISCAVVHLLLLRLALPLLHHPHRPCLHPGISCSLLYVSCPGDAMLALIVLDSLRVPLAMSNCTTVFSHLQLSLQFDPTGAPSELHVLHSFRHRQQS